ncbi:MAG TPA: M13 family metallopeptidase [Bryobacteraceae bacterium]|jgi:endothelin-converting enzyme/putative endopeptidase
MRSSSLISLFLCLTGTVLAQSRGSQAANLDTLPGFDPGAIDHSISPCTNFYQYACGLWLKNNPIPADQAVWGRFDELQEHNREILHQIAEKDSQPSASRTPIEQKVGDYWAACMNETRINEIGTEPLKSELARIAAMHTKQDVSVELARLHTIGVNALFNLSSGQDFKDSTEVIAQADQAGLGMPERDYYFKDNERSKEIRKEYVKHVAAIFRLLGNSAAEADAKADVVMKFETALAKGSLDVTARRDPANVYHRMPLEQLEKMDPAFDWPAYLKELKAPAIKDLNVAVPEFFKAMDTLLKSPNGADIKTYFVWQFVHNQAPLLPSAFVNENFRFYRTVLTGTKEMRPRWKRCIQLEDNELGEALGQEYVNRTFGQEGKQRTLEMVHYLEQALGQDIQKLDWMSPATRQRAMEKLHAITNKIGYPEKWKDYSSVMISRDDASGNSRRATEFEVHRDLNKIGKPVDRLEWQMTPPTVNAYYDPQMNNINFPAGILQPPFFMRSGDDAVNFGAIGAVIGHELTHGFDDQGRQFDAKGNLTDWWTEQDGKAFEQRADCFINQYGSYKVGDVNLNGKLTLGENVADNGGARIAYMALMDKLAGKPGQKLDGFTPPQRFFLGYAQIWCENARPEQERLQATTDPHSLPQYRVNGTLSNMPEFSTAFSCKLGQPMVRDKACHVW